MASTKNLQFSHMNEIDRLSQAIHSERHVRIICIGAGPSGLCLAYKLKRSFQKFSLTVYEKNAEIGGTWFENKYPGLVEPFMLPNIVRIFNHPCDSCACDVPAHNYTWSFEPKLDWSAVYAKSSEIFNYFNDFADKYSLRQFVQCGKAVSGATWDESAGGYHIQITDSTTGEIESTFCNIFINGGGILNAWRWPGIPGLEDFRGPVLHSANWDDTVDLTNKSVGLIGNG